MVCYSFLFHFPKEMKCLNKNYIELVMALKMSKLAHEYTCDNSNANIGEYLEQYGAPYLMLYCLHSYAQLRSYTSPRYKVF